MTLPLPDLDDLTYEDLVEEARSQIPYEYPDWTDHNPSDTGIVLIELLAWLSEMLLYRTNQIPEKNIETFLKLLRGSDWKLPKEELLQYAIRKTVLDLRKRYRAVTCEDYELLAVEEWNNSRQAKSCGEVDRARCIPYRNLARATKRERSQQAPGHISVAIISKQINKNDDGYPSRELIEELWQFLDERRLLTVRHHVVPAEYVPIQIKASLVLYPGASTFQVKRRATEAIQKFFDPFKGGPDGTGWPFGRNVYASEIYMLLDDVSGVDYVKEVTRPNRFLEHLRNDEDEGEPSDSRRSILDKKDNWQIELEEHQIVELEDIVLNTSYER